MANNYIVTDYTFRPFSFQEMLAPVQLYTEAYDTLETEMTNLDILANDIESKLTQNPEDAELRDIYNRFNADMQSALNSFYSDGYTADNKRKLNALKARYSKELNPINEAYKAYQEDRKYLDKLAIEHPEIIVEGYGDSISDYMGGRDFTPVSANLKSITESSKIGAEGLSKQFMDNIELQNVDGYIGRYLMYGKTQGISYDMVKDFTDFVDSKEALTSSGGKALYALFEKERAASNYYKMSPTAQKQIDASIIKGLVQGISYEEDIKYLGDNYWDIEAKKQNIDLIKAKLNAQRNNDNGDDTDLDLRTDSGLYKGANFDVSQIATLMGEQFETPIEYNGIKIYDPIQAYNIIHKNDSRIAELADRLDHKDFVVRNLHGTVVKYDSRGFNKFNKSVYIDGKVNVALTQSLREYEQLVKQREEAYDALDGIALTDKEVARVREYSGSSATGMITQDELTNFATKLETDFTAGQYNEESVTIFSHTNSKKGLEDIVSSISKNITTRKEAGVELNITTSDGKYIKNKDITNILDSDGKIDVDKIQSIDIDFRAAQTGTVKMVTTSGKVYYVDATYLGTQANNFIKGTNGLVSQYEEIMRSNITSKTKAEVLNRRLASIASSIQSQFDLNRNQSMAETISNTDLFEE